MSRKRRITYCAVRLRKTGSSTLSLTMGVLAVRSGRAPTRRRTGRSRNGNGNRNRDRAQGGGFGSCMAGCHRWDDAVDILPALKVSTTPQSRTRPPWRGWKRCRAVRRLPLAPQLTTGSKDRNHENPISNWRQGALSC